jgi:23S rRNA pseudouridine955/2504/2580 synthase
VHKEYVCLVRGSVEPTFESSFALKERKEKRRRTEKRMVVTKEACTKFTREALLWKNVDRSPEEGAGGQEHLVSLVVAELVDSGRSHQIRRHLQQLGHPILGDKRYGKGRFRDHVQATFGLTRVFLHAWRLTFKHPFTKVTVEVNVPLPKELTDVLRRLPNSDLSSMRPELCHPSCFLLPTAIMEGTDSDEHSVSQAQLSDV